MQVSDQQNSSIQNVRRFLNLLPERLPEGTLVRILGDGAIGVVVGCEAPRPDSAAIWHYTIELLSGVRFPCPSNRLELLELPPGSNQQVMAQLGGTGAPILGILNQTRDGLYYFTAQDSGHTFSLQPGFDRWWIVEPLTAEGGEP